MTEPEHVSATRAVYDATAARYARLVGTELTAAVEGPVDRALLVAFVESLGEPAGPVADVGCGPGRVAAFLSARGVDEYLDEVFADLVRVLAHDGRLLVAFQAGAGERVQRAQAYGTDVTLTSYRHSPEDVARRLASAGLRVHVRTVREPELDHESTAQAFVLAHRAPARNVSPAR